MSLSTAQAAGDQGRMPPFIALLFLAMSWHSRSEPSSSAIPRDQFKPTHREKAAMNGAPKVLGSHAEEMQVQ